MRLWVCLHAPCVPSSVQGQPVQALAQAYAAISDLRISAVPNLATPPPVFMPLRQKQQQPQQQAARGKDASKQQQGKPSQEPQQPPQQPKQQGTKGKASKQQATPANAAAATKKPQQVARVSAAANRAAAASSRVQDDSVFSEFEAELLCEELLRDKQPAASANA